MGSAAVPNTSRASTTLHRPPALIAATASATACSQRGPSRLPSRHRMPNDGSGGAEPLPRRVWGDGSLPRRVWGDGSPPRRVWGDGSPPRRVWGDGSLPRRVWGDGSPPRRVRGDGSPRKEKRGGMGGSSPRPTLVSQ